MVEFVYVGRHQGITNEPVDLGRQRQVGMVELRREQQNRVVEYEPLDRNT